jgi:gas vesicle protein
MDRDSSGDRDSGGAGHLVWFFIGAALGAAAAVVLTPRTGRETRDMLADHGEDVARRAHGWADDAQSQAEAWLDRSRQALEEQTQRIVSAVEAGRDAMREEIRKWSTSTRGTH